MEINPKKFYTIGKWVFFGIGVLGLAGLIDSIKNKTGTEIISTILSLGFNFAVVGFFDWLYRQEKKKEMFTVDGSMEDIAKKLNELEVSSEKTSKK
jgi:hypothetical protein